MSRALGAELQHLTCQWLVQEYCARGSGLGFKIRIVNAAAHG